MNIKGKPYGSEYHTIKINGKPLKVGNVKFITQNKTGSVTAPLETMTRGRVYAVIDSVGRVNTITYHDTNGKRTKSINLLHAHKNIKGPHVHVGYYHEEGGTRCLTSKEKALIASILKIWNNKRGK